jgi:hypothetical protein
VPRWTSDTNRIAPDAALGFWTNLVPYQVHLVHSVGACEPFLQAENISATGEWTPPNLSVANLQAQLYRGSLAADAQVNVHVPRGQLPWRRRDFDLQKHRAVADASGRRNGCGNSPGPRRRC